MGHSSDPSSPGSFENEDKLTREAEPETLFATGYETANGPPQPISQPSEKVQSSATPVKQPQKLDHLMPEDVQVMVNRIAPNATGTSQADSDKQLCPRCMRFVEQFKEHQRGSELQYVCPACSQTVSFRYVKDYHSVSRIKLSLAGMSGHGKTMFLRGIYSQLSSLGRHWPDFHFSPLSDDDGRIFTSAIADSVRGDLANPSQLAERPVSFELNGIPGTGNVHLILYDISGEAFESTAKLGQHAFFLPQSEVITFILSLSDVESGHEAAFMLSRMIDVLRFNGEDSAQKSLIVVLTKGDRLKASQELPPSAEFFLANSVVADPCDLRHMEVLSHELEDWLNNHPCNYWNFVKTANSSFLNVRYTIVSAIGSDPGTTGVQVQMNPRNIVSPLLWILRFTLPAIRVETGDVSNSFYDLFAATQAAASANPGASIMSLEAGDYPLRKSIEIKSSITIAGAGREDTRIMVCPGKSEFRIVGGVFTAKGVSFVSAVENGPVVHLKDARFNLSRCRFSGGKQSIDGNSPGHGIQLTGKASGGIRECIFEGNEGHGLLVKDDVRIVVESCEAQKNRQCGMIFTEQCRADLTGNFVHGNHDGITASANTTIHASKNICSNNAATGICIEDTAEVFLDLNKCHGNLVGVRIAKTAKTAEWKIVSQKNFISQNKQHDLRDLRRSQWWLIIIVIALIILLVAYALSARETSPGRTVEDETAQSAIDTQVAEILRMDREYAKQRLTVPPRTQADKPTQTPRTPVPFPRSPIVVPRDSTPNGIQGGAAPGRPKVSPTARERSDKKNDEATRLCAKGDFRSGIMAYELAIQYDSTNPRPKMNLARLLASCHDSSVRNGKRAVELALEGKSLSKEPPWSYLAIVAAAYAEAGDFEEAIRWGLMAKSKASGADAGKMDINLALFRNRQPSRWDTEQ